MGETLEEYVFQLQKGTPNGEGGNWSAKEITDDIKSIISDNKIELNDTNISMLLDEHNGLPTYLKKLRTVWKSSLSCSETVRNILEVMEQLLSRYGILTCCHLVTVKTAVCPFMNSGNAKQRELSYSILCQTVTIASLKSSEEITNQLDFPMLCLELFDKMKKPEPSTIAKRKFLTLVGLLAQHYPTAIEKLAKRILTQILYDLEAKVSKHDGKDNSLLNGYFEALTGLLYTFDVLIDQKDLEKLHNHIFVVASKSIPFSNRHSPPAWLKTLAEHASHFSKWFLGKSKEWFNCLKSYSLSRKADVSECGLKAFKKFIHECVQSLKNETDDFKKSTTLEFLVKNICEIMESENSSLKLRSLAMKALAECSFLLSGSNIVHIFEFILKKATLTCVQDGNSSKKNIYILPVCLESLGLVLSCYPSTLNMEQAQQLQKICVHLFSRYLDIAEKRQKNCGRSVATFLVGAHVAVPNQVDFSTFVENIVIHSLVRCSRPDLDSFDVKKHIVLLTTLMNFSAETDLLFSLEKRMYISSILDEKLIYALSTIIHRLNLAVEDEVQDSVDREEKKDVCPCPQNPADWTILSNLVDLMEGLLTAIVPEERLQTKIVPFGEEIIGLSTKFPLVPGLYRLVALIFSLIGETLPTHHRPSYEFYIANLIDSLTQLSDDILIFAMQAVLASPAWLVKSLKSSLSSALAPALKIGLTYPPIAEWPLNALEHWQETLPFSTFEAIMEDILPCLELYLFTVEQFAKEVLFIGKKRSMRSTTNANLLDQDAWKTTQRRVMKLLGRLGPRCSNLVPQNEDEMAAKLAIGWQISGHLELSLPLGDMKPKVQLDAFLPRILHLVHHTSNLKVRTAACEFLHASVVYMIGTSSQRTEEFRLQHSLTTLYSKIFPTILSLAVDADEIIRGLFSTLLFQLVHWFSRPSFQRRGTADQHNLLAPETILLVEMLMESVCNGLDASLARNLAADCLTEFLLWSVKQSSDTTLWQSPAGPDFLFQKLRASATHPSPEHRLGAAIVMNKLHRVIRESDPLTSVYTLDLLAHFVFSLSLAERDASSLGTIQQSKQVLYHLTRTISTRKEVFLNGDSRRRTAPFLMDGTLSEVLDFLLKHAFISHQHCREICVELCGALARPLSFKDVASQFLIKSPLGSLITTEFHLPTRLDVYRWLLHYGVIETSLCDTDVVFLNQYEAFAKAIEDRLDQKFQVLHDQITADNVLIWLRFLGEYLPKSKSNDLIVRPELLARVVLFPTRLGFSRFATTSRLQLYNNSEIVFPFLIEHKATILSVLIQADLQLDCLNWTNSDSNDILRGLILMTASGCLNANDCFCKPPNDLLKLAIRVLVDCPDNESGISSTRFKSSVMLLELALLLGLKMEILVIELKNPANIPNTTTTYGQYIRSKLEPELLSLVFLQLEKVDPFLPQLGNGDQQQWDLLLELLQAAKHAPPKLAEKKRWIVQKVLDSWIALNRHADSYNQRPNLRLIVDCLLSIDADSVGRNSGVRNWIIDSWNHPSTNVTFANELVQLLSVFAVNCSETEDKNITSALQIFFTTNFPSKASSLDTDSERGVYFSVINRMIEFVRIPVIFQFLIDVFALEPRHKYVESFVKAVKSENLERDPSDRTIDHALNKLFTHSTTRTVNPIVRMDAIEMVYDPLLSVVPSSIVERHLKELLGELIKLEEEPRVGIESFTRMAVFLALLATSIVRVDYQKLTSCINASYCALKNVQPSADGKDMLRYIMRLVLNIRKITPSSSQELELEVYQSMQRGAFKAIQSILTVTSADEEVVDKLLFKAMSTTSGTNPSPLWNAVVGTTKEYQLPVTIDYSKPKLYAVHAGNATSEVEAKHNYVPSQSLHQSSLSEDLYRFDFNQASLSSHSTQRESEEIPTISTEIASDYIVLKVDELNNHPCMKSLLSFLTQLNSKRSSLSDLTEPKWMNTLRDALLLPGLHRNAALFIIRLVIDLKLIFQPHAKSWYNTLLFALLRKIGGHPLNRFFREGIGMILEWSSIIQPSVDDVEFNKLASSIVQLIIKNAYSEDSEITRDNKEMLKSILGVWTNLPLEISPSVIEELMSSTENKKLVVGLQILDIVAFHGFLPVGHEFRQRFKQRLIHILSATEKRMVSRTCAALCGSVLKSESDKQFEEHINEILQKLVNKQQSDVFVDLLHEISTRYANVLSKFAIANLSFLESVFGNLKAKCFENLALSWQYMEDPWKEIGYGTFESTLKGKNPAELCPVLQLLKNLIPRIEIKDWKSLWPALVRLSRHENVECRSHLYEVFKKAFDLSDPGDPDFAQAILRGCNDPNQELAVKMQNFLAEKLPDTTTDRLIVYLTNYYCPGLEEYFLPFCSHFLLERTSHTHDYREPIFGQPLDDIPFETFDLASLGSQGHSGTPTWNSFGRSYSYGTLKPRGNFVRATQNRTFSSSTQALPSWLMTETQSLESPSVSKSVMGTAINNLNKPEIITSDSSWKRFKVDGPPSSRKYYLSPSKSSREPSNEPTIYRKYRKGELPDIQIAPSAFIAPLQAVALQDAKMAKILFCQLLSSIREKTKEIQGNNNQFSSELNLALESIVKCAHSRSPNSPILIAAVMEYFWTNSTETTIDTEVLVHLAKINHLQPLGILVLESSLPGNSQHDGIKRPRVCQVPRPSNSWFDVAQLYGDVEYFDSVRAIIINLTDCKEQTKQAIENESKGDWRTAFQCYSEVLKSSTSEKEMEFCNEYRLKCLEELGQWDEIIQLKPRKDPWKTRSLVRSLLLNFDSSHDVQELEHIALSSVDPTILTELALLYLRNGNKSRASVCISKASDDLISQFRQLSLLNLGGHRKLLQSVCHITELQSFLENPNTNTSTWNSSFPQTGDDVVVWNSILTLRNYFLQADNSQNQNEVLKSISILRLQLATVALEQKNAGLARKLLEFPIYNSPSLPIYQLLKSKIIAIDVGENKSSTLDRLIQAKEAIKLIDVFDDSVEVRRRIDQERFESSLCAQVFGTVNHLPPTEVNKMRAKLIEWWNVPPEEMLSLGLKHVRRQAEMADNQGTSDDMAEAHYILAKYYYEWKSFIADKEYAKEITRSILTSMRHGSSAGQSLFPLAIMAVIENSCANDTFESYRVYVPLEMFLPWVNQLVAYYTLSPTIGRLLVEISSRFPSHVRVPFTIARDSFSPDVLNMEITRKIESRLSDDTTWDKFLESIQYLHPPEKAAYELLNSENCVKDFPTFQSKYLNLQTPTDVSVHGHVHYAFSTRFTAKFQEAFEQGKQKELMESLKNFKKKTTSGGKSLRDYSPWLASYRLGNNITSELKIPSLNGGILKVEAFRDGLEYLNSKQLPVRLTFVVSGAVEYPVLIKHGEDVRKDERIVLLLNMIDSALKRDVDCRKRNLRMRSFQIVALTPKCGIFQWLTDTLTLKAFLNTDPNYRSSSKDLENEIEKVHMARICHVSQTNHSQLIQIFSKLAKKVYSYGLQNALKTMSQSPEAYFYLRNRMAGSHGVQSSALWILGVGDRHLSNFLVSTKNGDVIGIDYGFTFGTATTLLAIPEIVPCRLTTQFQSLIPGLGLNGPIRESMKHTLRVIKTESILFLAALSVFVNEPTLDWITKCPQSENPTAFIDKLSVWEPKEILQRTEKLLNGFHPSEIICSELQKNPIFLTPQGEIFLPSLLSIVRGTSLLNASKTVPDAHKRKSEQISVRASFPSTNLSTDQQIECLIDQSTDPACLSRMYLGWEPWV